MVARLLWPEEWLGLGGSQSPRFVLFRSYLISQRAAVLFYCHKLRGFPFFVIFLLPYHPTLVPLFSLLLLIIFFPQRNFQTLKDNAGVTFVFFLVLSNKVPEEIKTNKEFIQLKSIVCVAADRYVCL